MDYYKLRTYQRLSVVVLTLSPENIKYTRAPGGPLLLITVWDAKHLSVRMVRTVVYFSEPLMSPSKSINLLSFFKAAKARLSSSQR